MTINPIMTPRGDLNIKTRFQLLNLFKNLLELFMTLWVSMLLFTAIVLPLVNFLSLDKNLLPMRDIYFFIIGFATLCFILFRFRHYKETEIWSINQQTNTLNGGNPVHTTVDLSKIKKVIGGRPKHKWSEIILFRKKWPTDLRPAPALHDGRLTIQVTENTYLPLDIQHLGNGTEMMAAIVEICKDKFEEDYWFSAEERIALKPWKKNIIITTERNKI